MNGEKADDDQFYRYVGSAIRVSRTEQGLSQAQLAMRLGMSRASIGNIEAGRQRIQLHVLAWIAFHLARSIHALIPTKIETKRSRGMLPHEESVFTDESAQDFVEKTLKNARGES